MNTYSYQRGIYGGILNLVHDLNGDRDILNNTIKLDIGFSLLCSTREKRLSKGLQDRCICSKNFLRMDFTPGLLKWHLRIGLSDRVALLSFGEAVSIHLIENGGQDSAVMMQTGHLNSWNRNCQIQDETTIEERSGAGHNNDSDICYRRVWRT